MRDASFSPSGDRWDVTAISHRLAVDAKTRGGVLSYGSGAGRMRMLNASSSILCRNLTTGASSTSIHGLESSPPGLPSTEMS